MIRLGVNIDHVATLRQARRSREPDPIQAALAAEEAGADGITLHLREDRRHIQDRDVRLIRQIIGTRMNLEMGIHEEILAIALEVRPHCVCLVPERREEVTTEGGLDVAANPARVRDAAAALSERGAVVSLFLDPDPAQLEAAVSVGAPFVELHTGVYANAWPDEREQFRRLGELASAARHARKLGLRVNAGHGLTYHNVGPVAALPEIEELNIGHSIMSRAVMTGLASAVAEMKRRMIEARANSLPRR